MTRLTVYQRILAEFSDLNPLHLETLAYAVGSTLNGMPREFFRDIADLGEKMGAERLAEFHERSIDPCAAAAFAD
jgi:hypothetical protein